MSEERVLVPKRLGSLAAIAVFSWFLVRSIQAVGHAAWAWFSLVFSALCVALGAIQLLPGASFLRVNERGIEVSSLFRRQSYRWAELEGFVARRVGLKLVVTVNFSADSGRPSRRGLRRLIFGRDYFLPDSYGMAPRQLAAFLNDRRKAWAA